MRLLLRRTILATLALTAALLTVALPASAEDVVILKDGYTLRGKIVKERTPELTGRYEIKAYLDSMACGPKYVFYSGHAKKQLAVLEKGVARAGPIGYRRTMPGRTMDPLPAGTMNSPDWRDNWTRSVKVTGAGVNFLMVEQMITYLGPDAMTLESTTHAWRVSYDTRELSPDYVRKLLSTHPDLKDPADGVDPIRRLKIAEFQKDTGWLLQARQELARTKKDAKAPWPKEATERYDQLVAELDTAESKLIIDELAAAVGAGRYQLASRFVGQYEPKTTDPKDLTRLAELRATVEQVGPQYETTRRLLADLIDRTTGAAVANARGAAVGGLAAPSTPLAKPLGDNDTLLAAATAVLAELHPDTASRLDSFRMAADQDDRRVKAGGEAINKPDVLLALAVNGWLRGKNGAIPDARLAVKSWNTRVAALAYLRERKGNERTGLLNAYLASTNKLPAAELAQIVSLLPPVMPEPLDKLDGKLLSAKELPGVDRAYVRNTGPVPEAANGLDYVLRLPDEYHHGRTYPLVVALTDPNLPAEKMLAGLAEQANKHGYIVAAPMWTVGRIGPYDYMGKDHPFVTGVMRDVARRFQVDSDRVYLFGFGMGGTLALDLGLGRPDLFAGLTLFAPMPIFKFFQHTWTNAQKLPIFAVTGESSGTSYDSLRQLCENWLPNGFPSLLTVYKGRGSEWFQVEVPTAFDWMNRKTRARGVASLRLDDKRADTWKTMRPGDNRFYWVGAEEISPTNLFKNPDRPFIVPYPAAFYADIKAGNTVIVTNTVGLRKLVIWLEKDMIDWTKEVAITVDKGLNVPRKQVMEPDLKLMFEELYRTGDKKMLFFGKVEIKMNPI